MARQQKQQTLEDVLQKITRQRRRSSGAQRLVLKAFSDSRSTEGFFANLRTAIDTLPPVVRQQATGIKEILPLLKQGEVIIAKKLPPPPPTTGMLQATREREAQARASVAQRQKTGQEKIERAEKEFAERQEALPEALAAGREAGDIRIAQEKLEARSIRKIREREEFGATQEEQAARVEDEQAREAAIRVKEAAAGIEEVRAEEVPTPPTGLAPFFGLDQFNEVLQKAGGKDFDIPETGDEKIARVFGIRDLVKVLVAVDPKDFVEATRRFLEQTPEIGKGAIAQILVGVDKLERAEATRPGFFEAEKLTERRQERLRIETIRGVVEEPFREEGKIERAIREVKGLPDPQLEAKEERQRRITQLALEEITPAFIKDEVANIEADNPTVTEPPPGISDDTKEPETTDGKEQLEGGAQGLQDYRVGLDKIAAGGGNLSDFKSSFLEPRLRAVMPGSTFEEIAAQADRIMAYTGIDIEKQNQEISEAVASVQRRINGIENRGWFVNFLRILAVTLAGNDPLAGFRLIAAEQDTLLQLENQKLQLLRIRGARDIKTRERSIELSLQIAKIDNTARLAAQKALRAGVPTSAEQRAAGANTFKILDRLGDPRREDLVQAIKERRVTALQALSEILVINDLKIIMAGNRGVSVNDPQFAKQIEEDAIAAGLAMLSDVRAGLAALFKGVSAKTVKGEGFTFFDRLRKQQ